MKWLLTFLLATWGSLAWATTYYVSSSSGSDSNAGTSSSVAWQTMAHVNAWSFQPGDSILFKRGDVWNESLVPPSSGSSENPITFDAYGTGAAPNLTGYFAVPSTAWILVTGNAWKAPVPATYTAINFCLFGSVWGQKVAAVSSNLAAWGNFYLANGYLYVYSQGTPSSYYNKPIIPMALSNVPVININGQSWLTVQHFLVNWFDQYGVYVQGASDHLVFANMEADSMIPQGTQPLGFYIDEAAPGPGDIKIYNDEAHLNYDGFRFDGSATAITMVNDKGYANRDGALVDNTGAVTYSYCHFYASSLAVAGSTDVEYTSGSGPTAGAGNIAADTAPAVQVYQRYPAEVTLTVDDAGMTPGADTYYANTVLPIADAAGVPVGAAITVGYPLAQTLVSEFQGWINAGRDVTSHSISHTYYTNSDALEIQYTGSGTAATLSISSNTLTITVTGAADSVSYDLARGQPQGTMLGLAQALAATGKFTYSFLTPCQGPYGTGCSAYTAAALLSQDLADVSGQDVKSTVYHLQLNVTQLTTDEITLSRQWMTANLTGLPATPVYVYPGGYETTAMQGITEAVPYAGARGALKEDIGVKDTYADGFNVQNITSFGVNPSWMGLEPANLNQKIQALVWKESVWGLPWGIFWHWNASTESGELSSTEITNLIQDLKTGGATIQTNTGLVNWVLSGTQETGTDGNDYYTFPAMSMSLDFRPTENSPVVDAGQNLGTAYALDINGINQNSYGSGWEIGAHVYQGYATYGDGAGVGEFEIGGVQSLTDSATLPQAWVDNNEAFDGLNYTPPTYELSLPNTWVSGPPSGCVFHLPYWSGSATQAGLQSAIVDIEGCRTANAGEIGIILDVPPANYTGTYGPYLPQTASSAATAFLVIRSTRDANLPNGQTVCAHGIQDNLATSTDIGLDNPDCAGDAMYYQLGPTVTSISAGAFTLANGTATNTSSYNDVQYMWTAECSAANCAALRACSPVGGGTTSNPVPACTSTTIAPDHWLIEDAEVRPASPGSSSSTPTIVQMNGSGSETLVSQFPAHIHFRKIWSHGDWTALVSGTNSISNAFFLNCTYCSILDSQVSQIERPGIEHHAVLTDLSGPDKFNHNWFEGGSSCVFSGGFGNSGPPIAGLVPFQDIEMRRNRCTWPYAWLGQNTVPSGNVLYAGGSLVRKNIEELKNGERIIFDGNIFENVDNSGGQSGPIADFNVRNDSVGTGTFYQSIISDATVTNNLFRNSCEGLELDKSSINSGGGVSYGIYRFLFANNLVYSLTTGNPGCSSVASRGFFLQNSTGHYWQGTVTENSAGTEATFVANCSVDYGGCPGQVASVAINSPGTGCTGNGNATVSAPNIAGGFQVSVSYTCSGGALTSVSLTNATGTGQIYGSGYTSPPTMTPASGTGTITITMVSAPITLPTGAQVLDIALGDPVAVTMCTSQPSLNNVPTANYNGIARPSYVAPLASAGSSAWTGAPNTSNLTVTYPWPATASLVDSSGYCTVTNVQGGPANFTFQHNTVVTANTKTLDSNNDPASGGNYQLAAEFRDSILLGGGWNNTAVGEGTPTEKFDYDVTSMTADHVVWPTRTASSYTAYCNNPLFSCATPVMYFPATAYCTGATSTSSCVGFVGAMSTSSMPLTLPDYHNFALRSDSTFYAGATDQASDGTSMGANVPALDTAQTQNLYVCRTPCGSGPYPDLNSAIPSTLFGLIWYYTDPYPTIPFGSHRLWDTNSTRWQNLNTASNTYSFSNLDEVLQEIKANNGAPDVLMTLSATPTFISSDPTNSNCNYDPPAAGACGVPTDIAASCTNVNGLNNCDGRTDGTNQTWRSFIYALGTHIAGLSSATYQTVTSFDTWNEFTNLYGGTYSSWEGTASQMERLWTDANCILTGRGLGCTALEMGVAAVGVLPWVQVLTPSAVTSPSTLSTPFGTYLETTGTISHVDGVSVHTYVGGNAPAEGEMIAARYDTVNSLLESVGSSCSMLPCWSTEGSWGQNSVSETDLDLQAAFVARYYLVGWTSGFKRLYWYTYAGGTGGAGVGSLWIPNGTTGCSNVSGCLTKAGTAYGVIYNWMVGQTMTVPCANVSGTTWVCGLNSGTSSSLVVWDTSQTCSGGLCGTVSYTIPEGQYVSYSSVDGSTTELGAGATTVPVGAKPIMLSP